MRAGNSFNSTPIILAYHLHFVFAYSQFSISLYACVLLYMLLLYIYIIVIMATTASSTLDILHKKQNVNKDVGGIGKGLENGVVLHFNRALPVAALPAAADKLNTFKPLQENVDAAKKQRLEAASSGVDITTYAAAAKSRPLFADKRHLALKSDVLLKHILDKRKGVLTTGSATSFSSSVPSSSQRDIEAEQFLEGRNLELEQQEEPEEQVPRKLVQRTTLAPPSIKKVSLSLIQEEPEYESESLGSGLLTDKPPVSVSRKIVTKIKVPVSAAAAAVKKITTELSKKSEEYSSEHKYALAMGVKIGDTIIAERLPKNRPLPQIQASNFYMNNHAKFIQYINALFRSYRDELTSGEGDISCESLYGGDETTSVSLLTHQQIVRDYLNIYSPYRGLLLFHGLGSGKTCSSIAIAEGLKTFKKIIVMTPASLRMNYMEEMKTKCGDLMYKKNQFWEFVPSRGNKELTDTLAIILSISPAFISRNGGAWLVNVNKPSNYETELTAGERVTVDKQITEMISSKYEFVNYNGIRTEYIKKWSNDYTQNPFDNKVVVIDEAHNFVSRIVNKLKRPSSMAYRLYDFILSAQNAKVILLTGTPIINYPNEIAVLFNILRGNIDNWVFTINDAASSRTVTGITAPTKINLDAFKGIFGLAPSGSGATLGKRSVASAASSGNFARGIGLSFDNMEYNARTKKLIITRNPFGFVREYDAVSSSYKGVIRKADPIKYDKVKTIDVDTSASGAVVSSGAAASAVALRITDDTATENGMLSDSSFEKLIIEKLRENGIQVVSASTNKQAPYTALPSNKDEFNSFFIDSSTLDLKNRDLFIRRILGLTSYFRSAQEKLLPTYDQDVNFHVVESEMSDYQFAIYSRIRDIERNQESQKKKNAKRGTQKGKKGDASSGDKTGDLYDDVSSTYRIFSRAFCNFVFPPTIRRPLPGDTEGESSAISKAASLGGEIEVVDDIAKRISNTFSSSASSGATAIPVKRGRKPKPAAGEEVDETRELDENILDGLDIDEDDDEIIVTGDAACEISKPDQVPDKLFGSVDCDAVPEGSSKKAYILQYQAAISKAMRDLEVSSGSYLIPQELATYSPKFLHILQNILNAEHIGLHLLYSQFRTLEGIGILKLILETNGFSRFKIKQSSLGDWTIDMTDEELGRPCFALYTGTETPEEKEIIRNIFNSKWKNVPKTITDNLLLRSTNNMYGEVIKILMITASGAEGINLRNVRYVHVAEPYWHPVRTEQIIGRARRICSHIDLPEELRTVDVFLYVSRFSGRQLAADNDESLAIRMNDKSKTDNVTPMSTDQSLFEISNIKARITKQILTAVKESSFDCMIHYNPDSKEKLNCYSFGARVGDESLSYKPDITSEEDDTTAKLNKKDVKIAVQELVVQGKKYVVDTTTNIIYDLDLYKIGNLVERGNLVIIPADPATGEGVKYNVTLL